ncbi:hypothetical protein HBI56_213950 [Parastagonospora nodorum]|uniref:Uncharacterized protein n=1 Tax=Phaeosphaeria nodorum (strain SN15 / ATCC MYA-4574 / FGSC 10173) TaxID=321614 RepID=A0A7U2F5Y4_PHANO|nr:hypothetical protein HBH56_229890 [Parastagonospora nodorum]QRC99362.1 hypothetical protein JI435_142900 [Parastagonospora nodorum SN15]KAH3924421.1 hypothetical protein HBH54_195300 [Parastagonospora nodorum]KAH3940143.1 hypothetical protein HBH53_222890 [Parastagonospora nodorum]KAH3958423.1 hypothetical protein HBH51_209620 [Parastagonospora nodorum]
MDASTRLYTRLGEIPEDPNDPDSLAELLVCAFGAFERYYVCWKTQAGEYKQDGYDLPPALKDWLYPTDGTTRDFASLQVVFGRGEEYFASDKNGKMEFKEPEAKKQADEEEKNDRPALRRARTVSFLRPLSDISTRSDSVPAESAESRRSSAASSRRASRPPSLSYSRTSSAASMSSELFDPPSTFHPSRAPLSSASSQWEALATTTTTSDHSTTSTKRSSRLFELPVESISEEMAPTEGRGVAAEQQAVLKSISKADAEFKVPEGYMLVPVGRAGTENSTCKCGCHEPNPSQKVILSYKDISIQTEEVQSPARKPLRIDTMATSQWSSKDYSAVSQANLSPAYDNVPAENPIFMGRMMNYFSKPGYQLGDSLMSSYHAYEPMVYQYQDEFGEEALQIR